MKVDVALNKILIYLLIVTICLLVFVVIGLYWVIFVGIEGHFEISSLIGDGCQITNVISCDGRFIIHFLDYEVWIHSIVFEYVIIFVG